MNIRFGVELETKVPRTCGLAVGGYHSGYQVRTGRATNGQELAAPTFNEFVVSVPDAPAALARALDAGIVGGLDLAPYAPELGPSLLVCATELATRDAIDRLVSVLAGRKP